MTEPKQECGLLMVQLRAFDKPGDGDCLLATGAEFRGAFVKELG
jgi:hypothetical protein